MSSPFVGEIRIFCGSFAPFGWAKCDGQLMAISQNEALYALLGTTFGGDGQTTFALPDMRGRFPMHQGTHQGTPYVMGQIAGSETVTLNTNQMPGHTHTTQCNPGTATTNNPANNYWAQDAATATLAYSNNFSNLVAMNGQCMGSAGGSQPHENMNPFTCFTFIIALNGIFPSQN